MKKAAVVYWSGTGNTEAMANAVVEGVKKGGADVELFRVDQFGADKMDGFDGFLFGCPAMGDEVLEEDEFEPFFTEAEKKLSGVPVGLFGSYGWGDGAWMESWAERTRTAGAKLVADGVMVENAPDDDGVKACETLGETLAKAL
ncbi:flavodoxin [Selenomonas sputigena]|uniref:Flavodoxin n=1 Tax=Selenomonas sputigena TaxID=69823 RepID=A0ABV3X470_9FIRM